MERALDALGAGSAAVVEVTGEPGIGKTSLLTELRVRAEQRHHLVLAGRAAEFGRDEPFALLENALDEYLGSLGGAMSARLGSERTQELGAVFPSLATDGGRSENRAERYRLHRAVRMLLEELARERPVVVTLDDVHWADSATVELLLYLLRQRPAAPVLLALSYRPQETSTRLMAALEAAWREKIVERLAPEPLSRAEADALLGETISPESRERLYRESGGNPFYLEQLARAARAEVPRLRGRGVRFADVGAPPAVAAALAQELARLTPPVRDFARGASVVGDPFEPDVAAAAAGQQEADGLVALDELLGVDLVRPTEAPRRFRFRHPIVRRAVYESAGAGWRLAAHARIAQELERRGAPARARAPHVARSARAGDSQAITLLAEAAGSVASRAPETAAHWLQTAIDLLAGNESGRARRLELLIPLATCLGSAGRLAESRDTLREALELLPADAALMRARAIAFIALLERMVGNPGAADALLRAALAQVADQRSHEATLLKIELAFDSYFRTEFEAMRAWADEALAAAGALGDRTLLATAAGVSGLSRYNLGEVAEAAVRVDEAAALVDALPDNALAELLDVFFYLGWTEHSISRYGDSIRHFDRGLAIARATGQEYLLVPLTIGKAVPLAWRGDLVEAARLSEEAIEGAQVPRNDLYMTWALTVRCAVVTRMGRVDEAVRHGEQALALVLAGGDRMFSGALAGCYLAEAYLELGEAKRARELVLRWGNGEGLAAIEPSYRSHWYELLTRAALELGSSSEAEDWAQRAEAAADRVALEARAAEARRARAAVAMAAGNWADAAAAALAAADLAGNAGDCIEAARARVLAGLALAQAGNRDRALTELRTAANEFDRHGAERYRDAALKELRRLGDRRRSSHGDAARRTRDADGLSSLSKREHEVATLVSAGRTNREIAAELFISEKTVETHMASIFRKLDVSSRAAVAARVEQARGQRAA